MAQPPFLNKPELWSGFDGTAVEKVGKLNPRNWIRFPLTIIPGYIDFLEGYSHGGGEVAGVVSTRPNNWPRRFATAQTIARGGLGDFYKLGTNVHLLHTEARRAEKLANRAGAKWVATVDDNPQKIGLALVKEFAHSQQTTASLATGTTITLGAVPHELQAKRLDDLRRSADAIPGVEVDMTREGMFGIAVGEKTLCVRAIGALNYDAGEMFAVHTVMDAYAHR